MTRSPAAPKTRSWKKSRRARSASSSDSMISTPFPPASPSAFSTTGKPYCLIAWRASSAAEQTVASAVGMPWRLKNSLEKTLEDLDLRGQARGPEDRQLSLLELVHDAERERQLGPDDGQVDVELLGQIGDLDGVARRDRKAVRDLRDAGIAGRAEDLLDHRAAMERPAERMLPPPSADDQDLHAGGIIAVGFRSPDAGGGRQRGCLRLL